MTGFDKNNVSLSIFLMPFGHYLVFLYQIINCPMQKKKGTQGYNRLIMTERMTNMKQKISKLDDIKNSFSLHYDETMR